MAFIGLTKEERKQLEFEVVSEHVRLRLTRLLRQTISDGVPEDEDSIRIMRQNRIVNIARNVLGLSIYVLKDDGWGNYHPAEFAWHNGESELVMRRPSTAQLVETIGDLIQDGALNIKEVNEILEDENLSFRFKEESNFSTKNIYVHVLAIDKIEDKAAEREHQNIRVLINRMDSALEHDDTSGVLHASASIFETLAKDVIKLKTVQNQTLASFFERYRKDSKLPSPVLDYILDIYNLRNTEPLAAHGSLSSVNITKEEAIFLSEMTKAFVRIERRLANFETQLKNEDGSKR